jgi:hypothetical protein
VAFCISGEVGPCRNDTVVRTVPPVRRCCHTGTGASRKFATSERSSRFELSGFAVILRNASVLSGVAAKLSGN